MSLLTRLWHIITDHGEADSIYTNQRVREQADRLRGESEEMIRVIDRNRPSNNPIQDMVTGRYKPVRPPKDTHAIQ